MASLIMVGIADKIRNQIPITQSEAEYLLAEVKRLNEAYQQAKSEAFQAQRQIWGGHNG